MVVAPLACVVPALDAAGDTPAGASRARACCGRVAAAARVPASAADALLTAAGCRRRSRRHPGPRVPSCAPACARALRASCSPCALPSACAALRASCSDRSRVRRRRRGRRPRRRAGLAAMRSPPPRASADAGRPPPAGGCAACACGAGAGAAAPAAGWRVACGRRRCGAAASRPRQVRAGSTLAAACRAVTSTAAALAAASAEAAAGAAQDFRRHGLVEHLNISSVGRNRTAAVGTRSTLFRRAISMSDVRRHAGLQLQLRIRHGDDRRVDDDVLDDRRLQPHLLRPSR